MKLIEFLISEGKKGWDWPGTIVKAVSNKGSRGVNFYFDYACQPSLSNTLMSAVPFSSSEVVTREQYEAALAASKSEWDGEGLPPVGCECEYKDTGTGEWMPVEIKYSSSQIVVFSGRIRFRESAVEISKDVVIDEPQFRPIRSEADKKRAECVIALSRIDPQAMPFEYGDKHSDGSLIGPFWYELYDAIAAGKIPHIRID